MILGSVGRYYSGVDEEWETVGGKRILTTYSRWDRSPLGQLRILPGGARTFGPVAPTGTPHGEWFFFPVKGSDEGAETIWLWYGEIVKEGEWHARNGKYALMPHTRIYNPGVNHG